MLLLQNGRSEDWGQYLIAPYGHWAGQQLPSLPLEVMLTFMLAPWKSTLPSLTILQSGGHRNVAGSSQLLQACLS